MLGHQNQPRERSRRRLWWGHRVLLLRGDRKSRVITVKKRVARPQKSLALLSLFCKDGLSQTAIYKRALAFMGIVVGDTACLFLQL